MSVWIQSAICVSAGQILNCSLYILQGFCSPRYQILLHMYLTYTCSEVHCILDLAIVLLSISTLVQIRIRKNMLDRLYIVTQLYALHSYTLNMVMIKSNRRASSKCIFKCEKLYVLNPTPRIPNSCSCCCVTKSVKWRYLGNQAWYVDPLVSKRPEKILNKKIK